MTNIAKKKRLGLRACAQTSLHGTAPRPFRGPGPVGWNAMKEHPESKAEQDGPAVFFRLCPSGYWTAKEMKFPNGIHWTKKSMGGMTMDSYMSYVNYEASLSSI